MSLIDLLDARRTLRQVQLEAATARADHAKALAAWRLQADLFIGIVALPCDWVIVAKVYAPVPPRPTTSANAATVVIQRSLRPPRTIATTATPAPMSRTHRNQGSQSGVRASSTKLHAPVAATMTANTTRAAGVFRRAHSMVAPMATRAAIAGARATV